MKACVFREVGKAVGQLVVDRGQAHRAAAGDVRDLHARRLAREDSRTRALGVRRKGRREGQDRRARSTRPPRHRPGARRRRSVRQCPRISPSTRRARPSSNRSTVRTALGHDAGWPATSACPSRGRAGRRKDSPGEACPAGASRRAVAASRRRAWPRCRTSPRTGAASRARRRN